MSRPSWRERDLEAQEARWTPLLDDGATIGGLVTLGHSVILYSRDPRLRALDGQRFDSAFAARQAMAEALAEPADRANLVWLHEPPSDAASNDPPVRDAQTNAKSRHAL